MVDGDGRRRVAARRHECHAILARDRHAAHLLDREALERVVVDRLLDGFLRVRVEVPDQHGPAVAALVEPRLERVDVRADQPRQRGQGGRRVGERGTIDDHGIAPACRHRTVRARHGATADDGAGRVVDVDDAVVVEHRERGPAILERGELPDPAVERGELLGPWLFGRIAAPHGVQAGEVERQQLPAVGPDDQQVRLRIDRHGRRARDVGPRHDLARVQVVADDLVAGRDPQLVAAPATGQGLVGIAALDRRIADRHVQLAGLRDVVPGERDDARRHRVLREVRVRPLVDLLADAVAPELQELGGRPRVIDLVEVHLDRLFEAEGAEQQRGDDEHREEPQVEAVEAAAGLPVERCRAIRTRRRLADAITEADPPWAVVVDAVDLPRRERSRPGRRDGERHARRARARGAGAHRARASHTRTRPRDSRARRPRREWPARLRLPLANVLVRIEVPGVGQIVGEPSASTVAELDGRPGEDGQLGERHERDPEGRAQVRPDPQPVADVVARVDRGQDDVHVREGRHARDHVGDGPAPRDDGEDRPDRDQREQVALVDPCREDEEREGQDGQPDEDRQPVGASGDEGRDAEHGEHQQHRPDDDGRQSQDRRVRGVVLRRAGDRVRALRGRRCLDVADPATVLREAPGLPVHVGRHEGPRVVRVDGEVRIARGGLADLLGQADDRQAERRGQDDRGQQARKTRREDPDRGRGPALPGEARRLGLRVIAVGALSATAPAAPSPTPRSG